MGTNVDERLGERDGRFNSDEEVEREVRTMMEGYDVGLDDM